VRIVVCDGDSFMQEMVESIVAATGHEVVGIATDTASGVGLLEAARPDVAVIDVALGVGSDFDLVSTAGEVGSRVVVFAQQADIDSLHTYAEPPTVVFKPDFRALEGVLAELAGQAPPEPKGEEDRRQHPTRAAEGPVPTSISDAQAFFEAVNNSVPGDALLAFDVPVGAEEVAGDVLRRLRETDRVLLILPRAVRCYLPAGGEEGIQSVLERVKGVSSVTEDCTAAAITVAEGEHGADAFERLKREGEPHPLR
jgi:CheY-like chemotaxis protein